MSFAAKNGHTDLVKLLLQKGADANILSSVLGTRGELPIHMAGKYIFHLQFYSSSYIYLFFYFAARKGQTEIVKLLLAKGSEINAQSGNEDGDTPIVLASTYTYFIVLSSHISNAILHCFSLYLKKKMTGLITIF